MTPEQIINHFNMKPLPEEGGWYTETYRSAESFPQEGLPARYDGRRNFSTAILYLITKESFSKLHRVKSDEIFHFHTGDPAEMLQLSPNGTGRRITIGTDILAGHQPQVIVENGIWQGCRLADGGRFALLGCTVSPGFEFTDYETGERMALLRQYPGYTDEIIRLS